MRLVHWTIQHCDEHPLATLLFLLLLSVLLGTKVALVIVERVQRKVRLYVDTDEYTHVETCSEPVIPRAVDKQEWELKIERMNRRFEERKS